MDISAQKYKIWINASWMIFMSSGQFKKQDYKELSMFVLLQSPGIKDIQNYMKKLWIGDLAIPVIVISKDVRSTWQKLLVKSVMIYAAGGVVQREDGKFLFIYRRGWWDLPKGKLDAGENNKQAAIREVREEVGLNCTIVSSMPKTFHCYEEKGRLVIKETAWYIMKTGQKVPVLQSEEDIMASKWVSKAHIKKVVPKLYPNLKMLVSHLV